MKDLKEKTIRGGSVRVCSQATVLFLRVGSLALLARLLDPTDFGLVGMVTAFTGVLNLFRDFGLSSATIQRATVTEEETSTLFWINVLVGAVLTVVALVFAPAVGSFYHEPRLFWVTIALAPGFLFNAAGVQHSALSATPDALHRVGIDRSSFADRQYHYRYCHGQSWLWILGPDRHDR